MLQCSDQGMKASQLVKEMVDTTVIIIAGKIHQGLLKLVGKSLGNMLLASSQSISSSNLFITKGKIVGVLSNEHIIRANIICNETCPPHVCAQPNYENTDKN